MKTGSHTSSSSITRPLLYIVSLIVLAILALLLYPTVHPSGGLRLTEDETDIKHRCRGIISSLQLDSTSYEMEIQVVSHPELLERTYGLHGMSEGNRRLHETGSGYYWRVRIKTRGTSDSTIQIGSSSESEKLRRLLEGDISFHFDMKGKIVGLSIPVSDSLNLPSISTASALEHARSVLLRYVRVSFLNTIMTVTDFPDSLNNVLTHQGINYSFADLPRRRDHKFAWTVYDESVRDSVDLSVSVSGNTVSDFQHSYRSLATSSAIDGTTVAEILEIIFYAVICIIMLAAGFRRLRAYEIGFRSAIVIGITSAALMAAWLLLQIMGQFNWDFEIIISLLIAPIFVGVGFVLLWAISESVGRETWKEKFITFDLLFHGQILHSRVGSALLIGLTAGFFLMVLSLVTAQLVSMWSPVWILQRSSDGVGYLSSPIPSLFLLGEAVFSNIAGCAFFLIFLVSILRQRIRNTVLLVVVTTLCLTLIDPPNLVPLPQGYLILLPLMATLVILFIRTDIITALTAMITLSVLNKGLVFLTPGNIAFHGEGLILAALLVLVIIIAFISQTTPDRVSNPEDFAPVFQRHITERQRLSRELEIARDVQRSFLPKRNPIIAGLDIASHCAPAFEVGGDYYDFVDMGPGKLGIAIGDVSGKGTQAAFYMTLTKGFLKALGRMSDSPSIVLTELNRLFYENVERGHFISMIYAVFDMDSRILTIARAGHSPVMHRKADSTVSVIQSRGIALGFEAGEKFSATIEEVTVPLQKNDVFVLYTDGYPEAMTSAREEFGEQRLSDSLQRYKGDNAQHVLDHLYTETQRFTGRALQHDDMTMVVVHVH
jgi:sigma-B regulation protein RsbU (phosphoserine phosphatase)